MSKTWGICGTSTRSAKRPGFMSATSVDALNHYERDSMLASRRTRGLCEVCGRVLAVATIDAGGAQLLCSCGYRAVARRNSRAYRNAVLIAGGA